MIIILVTVAIILLLGVWFVLNHLHIIPVRQAQVVCDRITGHVRHIVAGPAITLLWPVESALPLDLTVRKTDLSADDIITSDLAVSVSLDIFYAFDPTLLQATDIDRILPIFPEVEKIVQSWANYILRSLVAGYTTTELLAASVLRARLERLLRRTLQDRMQLFGVRIHTIRLLWQPIPMLLSAQFSAARTQMAAEARAHALATLNTAFSSDYNLAKMLPLEILQQMQRSDQTMTALNLSVPVGSKVKGHSTPAVQWMITSN